MYNKETKLLVVNEQELRNNMKNKKLYIIYTS